MGPIGAPWGPIGAHGVPLGPMGPQLYKLLPHPCRAHIPSMLRIHISGMLPYTWVGKSEVSEFFIIFYHDSTTNFIDLYNDFTTILKGFDNDVDHPLGRMGPHGPQGVVKIVVKSYYNRNKIVI